MKTSKLLKLLCFVFALSGCGVQTDNQTQPTDGNKESTIKVLYFHGKQRCMSCLAIEKFTEELLREQYSNALESDKIIYKSVDIDDNEALANQYEIAWSSLILDKDGQVVDLTDIGFRYAHSNPEEFKHQLRTEIDKLLE